RGRGPGARARALPLRKREVRRDPRARRLAAWLLSAAVLCLAPDARAQVACELDVAPMSFGDYDTLSPAGSQVTGSVTVTCRLLDPNAAERISYSIALGPGSGSYARRTMRAAGTA